MGDGKRIKNVYVSIVNTQHDILYCINGNKYSRRTNTTVSLIVEVLYALGVCLKLNAYKSLTLFSGWSSQVMKGISNYFEINYCDKNEYK